MASELVDLRGSATTHLSDTQTMESDSIMSVDLKRYNN